MKVTCTQMAMKQELQIRNLIFFSPSKVTTILPTSRQKDKGLTRAYKFRKELLKEFQGKKVLIQRLFTRLKGLRGDSSTKQKKLVLKIQEL